MKAAWYNEFGPAEEVLGVGERPKPMPNPGEVLVKLHTSGVNPSDVKKRAGSNPAGLDAGPVIPHSDGAGIIEEVGYGVPVSRIGERVWVYNAQYGRQNGTAAEYVTLPGHQVVWMPRHTGFDVGACMGIPFMTAHRCVLADGSVKGQTIMITGGAGRVGHYAIQLAKLHGATVITTASSQESEDHCMDAGADLVVGHPSAATMEQVLEFTGGKKIDRLVEGEFGGNLDSVLEILNTGATIATYASMQQPQPTIPFYRMMYLDLTLRLIVVYAMPEAAKLEAIRDATLLLERNQLQHRIAHKIPLSEIVTAHDLIESNEVKGCVIVTTH